MSWRRIIVLVVAVVIVAAAGLALAVVRSGVVGPDLVARHAALFESFGLIGLFDRALVDRHLQALDLNGPPRAVPSRPDVVVIVLDTLRRDRLRLHGYTTDTMPRLERWAERARVFTDARSTSSWTLPAHASLFTGLHAIEHGARGKPLNGDGGGDAYALDDRMPTLAEALREEGYATIGLAANRGYLRSELGLARGFDLWLCEEVPAKVYATAERITAMALRVLGAPRSRPLFLFVNYMDPHQPIHLREGYTPRIDEVDPELLPYTQAWVEQSLELMEERTPLDPKLVESWSLGYDGELRYLDEHLGVLLERLPDLGIDDDDIVVVLSDHGESFGEHDVVEHSKALYDELTRIPLFVRGPGFDAGHDPTPAQIPEVPGWILDAAGIEVPFASTRSDSLQVMELYWTRHKDLKTEALRRRFDRVQRAFVRDGHKLVLDDRDEEQLFDLERDAGETAPLEDAGWAAGLRDAAAEWVAARSATTGTEPAVNDEQLESLRALGYVE